jgi:hypothetical protein
MALRDGATVRPARVCSFAGARPPVPPASDTLSIAF